MESAPVMKRADPPGKFPPAFSWYPQYKKPVAGRFEIGSFEVFVVFYRKLYHAEPVLSESDLSVELKRRRMSRHDEHLIQPRLLSDVLRQNQMTVMDGVETPPSIPIFIMPPSALLRFLRILLRRHLYR